MHRYHPVPIFTIFSGKYFQGNIQGVNYESGKNATKF
jgi:hypothetical protein